MKFLSLVFFLSTFGASYGAKEGAVEAECSKHDNGLRKSEDDQDPEDDQVSVVDPFANDVMHKTVVKEINLPGPNEKPPEEKDVVAL